MRHEQENNFDLQMRSMLQDAEVKVPSRVWRAVSARLEEPAAAAASPWGWTRWAGLSLAVAGALAAALVLSGTFDRRSDAPLVADVPSVTVVEGMPGQAGHDVPVVDASPVMADASPVMADPIGHPAKKTAPAAVEETTSVVEEMPGQAGHDVALGPDVASGHDAPAVEDTPAADASPVMADESSVMADPIGHPAQETAPVNQPDPFALLAAEDARHARTAKVSLVAQGSFTGNRGELGAIQHTPFSGSSGKGSPSQIVTEKSASNYGIPVSFGLGVRIGLAPRWSLGVGVNYSILSRSFTGEYQSFYGTVNNTQHYIGVPLNLYFDILSTDIIRFYAHAGGAAEYCVSNQFRLERPETPNLLRESAHGLQYSAGAGLGVEFMLSRRLGAYIDPGVRYYFPGEQPKNVRTDNPFLVTFEAGLRFDLGNR